MVPQPLVVHAQKINVCLTCGHKGDLKRLIYCIQCKACAQHCYCLEKIHRNEDGKVIWRCEDCTPNNPKCKPEPSKKSERISYATEAKYKKMMMIMKKKSYVVRKQPLVRSNEGESVGCLAKNDTEKVLPTLENENVLCKQPESPKVNETEKVLPTLENENVLCKQTESPKVKDPSNMSSGKQAMECEIYAESEVLSTAPQFLHYPEFDGHSRAQPLSDPIWTGQFRLNNATHFHLVAYISSKASPKVKLAVTELPKLLDVEMLSRRVIWPQSFDAHPPNSDYIALYFFPQYERDEMIFDRVMNEAIEQDKALKVVTNNLNVFIFSSHLLPPDDRREKIPFSHPSSTQQHSFNPSVSTYFFHTFRSHHIPKGHDVPFTRKFSRTVSVGAKHKEGLKLLVTGGSHAQKVVGIWLFGSAAWVFSMVVLGGLTRLTRSGLSMTDWKFTGEFPPLSDEAWLQEFEKYQQSPEYKRVNRGMKIEEFKFIYWMEYGHRMWGRALGIMFVLPYSYFLSKGYITLRLGLRLSVLFGLGAGQGLIGWWMVKSGLEEPPTEYSQPRVSPYRLAAHLTSAFAIYCGLFWSALSVVMPKPPAESLTWVRGAAKVKRLALPVSLLVGLTAVSGAFVAGNDAGHAFNTFPKMGDTWIPEDILEMKPLIRNFFENTSTVQLNYRILATATLISVSALWLSTRKLDTHPAVRSVIGGVFGMASLQVTLGISTLLSYVPVSLGTAHQAGALTLLTFMLLLNHTVRRPSLALLKSLPQVVKAN